MAADTNRPPDRPALTIKAGFSIFLLRSNMFLYTNGVSVIDPPAKPGDSPTTLTCRWAVARMGPNRRLETVWAHEGVAIDQGDNHARGALAIYTATNETMTLTGAFDPNDTNLPPFPVLYSPQGSTFGTNIIYDRIQDKLFIGRPTTIVPQKTLSTGERGSTNSAATNKTSIFSLPLGSPK
ncbi:MAG TPA: hypothetical protein VNT99_18340 [Methylomirabilota bacterium]|nr:hypothetical protein [Methylomirabilota bacterium]